MVRRLPLSLGFLSVGCASAGTPHPEPPQQHASSAAAAAATKSGPAQAERSPVGERPGRASHGVRHVDRGPCTLAGAGPSGQNHTPKGVRVARGSGWTCARSRSHGDPCQGAVSPTHAADGLETVPPGLTPGTDGTFCAASGQPPPHHHKNWRSSGTAWELLVHSSSSQCECLWRCVLRLSVPCSS